MRESQTASAHAEIDPVRVHVALLHKRAAGLKGIFVVSTFLEDRGGTITHHKIGDVDGMAAAIHAHYDTLGANVFTGLHLMRPDLERGKRGTTNDMVAVLGL